MKKILTIFLLIIISSCSSSEYSPQNGDVIFHTSRSSQSVAIQKATKSKYSHVGIVYLKNGNPFVYEAAETVKLTPLNDWIARGEKGEYVVKRLINSDKVLDANALRRMLDEGKKFEGKPYDLYFEWSDNRIYCSELVWKIYKKALGLELGKLQRISEFDLSDPIVQNKIRERFGNNIPTQEIVISPVAIFKSEYLKTAYKK